MKLHRVLTIRISKVIHARGIISGLIYESNQNQLITINEITQYIFTISVQNIVFIWMLVGLN